MAAANQIQKEVSCAAEQAEAGGTRLATLGMNSEVRFVSAEQRAQFAEALESAVLTVIKRYSSPFSDTEGKPAEGGAYRLLLGCYPIADGRRRCVEPESTVRNKTFGMAQFC